MTWEANSRGSNMGSSSTYEASCSCMGKGDGCLEPTWRERLLQVDESPSMEVTGRWVWLGVVAGDVKPRHAWEGNS